MALALESKHDGTIRFYQEPIPGVEYYSLLAVFPPPAPGAEWRNAYSLSGGYTEVPVKYVRNLRTASETADYDIRLALRMLERIDQRSEYVRELERNGA